MNGRVSGNSTALGFSSEVSRLADSKTGIVSILMRHSKHKIYAFDNVNFKSHFYQYDAFKKNV